MQLTSRFYPFNSVPKKIACVTFQDKTACEIIQLKGELDMGGVKVAVVPPPPPPPNWTNVLAPVVQRLDNAIHRINRYPADKC